MTSDPASLQNLHDIVIPPPIPFWPPAPGWYLVAALLLGGIAWLVVRLVGRHRRNAYRRAALAELAGASTLTQLVEILKRTALAAYPRRQVAGLTGEAWTRWLAETADREVPPPVAEVLTRGVYARSDDRDRSEVSAFCAGWIRRHRGARSC